MYLHIDKKKEIVVKRRRIEGEKKRGMEREGGRENMRDWRSSLSVFALNF